MKAHTKQALERDSNECFVCRALQASAVCTVEFFPPIAARRYWLFLFLGKEKRFVSDIQFSLFRTLFWEVMSETWASCFIRGSNTSKQNKHLAAGCLELPTYCNSDISTHSEKL